MPVPAEWAVVYCLVCILVVFPSMVAAGSSPAGRLEGVFEWLGRMSYGIYSVHYPLIWLALAGTTIVEFDKAAIGVTLVVALIVIADPLHNLDLRIRRWIRSAFPIVRPAR